MKRIIAVLKDKFEAQKVNNKVKRVELALASAELNFKTAKEDNEIKLQEVLEGFKNPDKGVEDVIQNISDTLDAITEATEGLEKVAKIKEFLFEEVKED